MAETGKCAPSPRRTRTGIVMPVLLAVLLTGCHSSSPTPSPIASASPGQIAVTINGNAATTAANAKLGQLIKQLQLSIHAGRLMDVEGEVINKGAFPAHYRVNDHRATRATVLHAGDVIEATSGNDHTEETEIVRQPISGTQPHNPQYFLGTAPGETVTTVGKISGKSESVVFEASGKGDVPKAIALTFDDGPNGDYTPKILKILHHFHVSATFFLIGYEAQKFPSLAKKEVDAGHTVGNHSWSHPTSFAGLDDKELDKQLSKTQDVLNGLGIEPFVFRPPGGSYDASVVEAARRYGMRTVIWTIDTHDYVSGTTADQIVQRVLSAVKPGSIVLMHDGGGDRSATVKALPDIIKGIRKKGYDLVPLTPND